MTAEVDDEVWALECAGWDALATSGAAAAEFYGRVLDREVTMILPGGLVLADRSAALAAMSGPPWAEYELADERVLRPVDGVAVAVYTATARRGDEPYRALISSTYAHRTDGWKLVLHQQTPR